MRVSNPTRPIRSPLPIAARASAADAVARPVERGAADRAAAHAAADVDHRDVGGDDLVLEIAHHQLAAPRGRLPRDELERIAVAVLAQLAQLARQAAPPHVVLADLLVQRAADRAHRLAAHRERPREHLDRDRVGEERLDVEQPERVAERQRGAVQHLVAGGERLDHRGDLDLLAALDRRARPVVDLQGRGREDLGRQDPQLAAAVVAEREVELERPVGGERAAGLVAGRDPPRQLDLLAAEQDRRRVEPEVQRAQHRDRSRPRARPAAGHRAALRPPGTAAPCRARACRGWRGGGSSPDHRMPPLGIL